MKDKITFEIVYFDDEWPDRRIMLRTMHNGICVKARRFSSVVEALEGADGYVMDMIAKGRVPKGGKVTITVNYKTD